MIPTLCGAAKRPFSDIDADPVGVRGSALLERCVTSYTDNSEFRGIMMHGEVPRTCVAFSDVIGLQCRIATSSPTCCRDTSEDNVDSSWRNNPEGFS
jgi:hypothetical protein